jgi:HK97 family phage major capsid protein
MTMHPGAFRAIELKDADADADTNEVVLKAISDVSANVEARLAEIETKSADRLSKLEAKLNRPATIETKADDKIEQKAFMTFARRGVERMSADEQKGLTVATDAAGGFLAPEQFGSEILKALVQFSPIRAYAKVIQIGASEIKFPKRISSGNAFWVAETADRTASEPAYGQVTLTPHELATFTDVSTQLLEDAAYNLEGELALEFAENFGRVEGQAFVSGDGTGKPKGLLVASGIANLTTGSASAFPASNPADVLIGMYHALPNTHAQNAVWLMNRNTLGTIRKWKTTTGEYLILDPIAGGVLTLLGRPIVEAIDMPDIGAGNVPIIFGDMQGYRIVDRVGLSVLRDPFSLATKGQVRMHARRRVGADLTHPDRFVKLTVAV